MSIGLRAPCDTVVPLAAAETETPCARRRERWVLATAVLASAMAFVDATVVNVMLPVLQTALAASVAEIQWVVEAYALCLTALLLLGGALGDRFGRRRVLAAGIATFTLASLACAAAPSVGFLIVGRAVQGMGAALLVPGSLAVISVSFARRRRARAIGLWSGLTAVASGSGLLFGGVLLDTVSWRAIFAINAPVAAIALILLYRHVPESANPASNKALDWPGSLWSMAALGGFCFALIESAERGPANAAVIAALAIGAVASLGFVRNERRCAAPMMPPHLFRAPDFGGANLLTFVLYAGLAALFFFLPLNLVQIQGWSATAAGTAILPVIAAISLLSGRVGRWADRYGARRFLIGGPLLMALGFAGLLFLGRHAAYWPVLCPALTLVGLGLAASVAPLTATVMAAVDDADAGLASGINNAVSRAGGMLAIALFGPVFYAVFAVRMRAGLAESALSPTAHAHVLAHLDRLGALEAPGGVPAAQAMRLRDLVEAAFVAAFDGVIGGCIVLAVAASLVAWLWIGASPHRAPGS